MNCMTKAINRKLVLAAALSGAVSVSADVVFPSGATNISANVSYGYGTDGALVLESGAEVNVASGVSVGYDAGEVTSVGTPVLTVAGGSELKIGADASVSFSDFAGTASFAGAASQTATVTVAGGSLTFAATRVRSDAMMYPIGKIEFGEYSKTVVSGDGVLDLSIFSGHRSPRNPLFTVTGGELYFCDNARFYYPTTLSGTSVIRRGRVEFSGSSAVDFTRGENADIKALSGFMINCNGEPGESAEVHFNDHAGTETGGAFNLPHSVRLANSAPGTWSRLYMNSDGVISLGMHCVVGISDGGSSFLGGGALVEINDGYARTGGNQGLAVGLVNAMGSVCTGIVHVAGGGFLVRAGLADNGNNAFCGSLIGRGPAVVADEVYSYATLSVSGGVFTNQCGHFVVGTGRSVGSVVQTGGEIHSTPSLNRPLVLGFVGGDGSYAVSNGYSRIVGDVYVGGAAADDLDLNAGTTDFRIVGAFPDVPYAEDYTLGGSVGKLTVASAGDGGKCLFENTYVSSAKNAAAIVVGKEGTGEVEIGEGGAIICLGMKLCGPTATLRFTLGPEGKCCGSAPAFLRVKKSGGSSGAGSGTLVIEDGAKLVVDVTRYTGRDRWVELIRPVAREGEFAAENITVSGGGEVVQNRPGYAGIWVRIRPGFSVVVR